MKMAYTKRRKVMMRHGLVGLQLHIHWSDHAGCERFHLPYHPEAGGHWVLPAQEPGLDVIARVGELRYREHRSCPDIHCQLRQEGTSLALRWVQNLLAQYDLMLSLALETLPERAAELTARGRVILSIDGLQPGVGHEVLWVVRDVLSGAILCARSLLSSSRAELQNLIERVPPSLHTRTAPVTVRMLASVEHGRWRARRVELERKHLARRQRC
jgi:hypothetical protein